VFRARVARSALLALTVPALALSVTAGQASAASGPAAKVTMGGSSPNWAGYVAYGTKFRYVTATFTVPRLDCQKTPGTGAPSMASDWVGLDGAGSRTVEQDGVLGQCLHGVASYYAWWETYPKAPVYPSWNVRPGDVITASVWYDAAYGKYQLVLTDKTSGRSFSDWERCGASSCDNVSAEVITESPGASKGYYALADWGTSTFRDVSITDAAVQRGDFYSGHWQYTSVTMHGRGDDTKAWTGGLYSGGAAFQTHWENKY
jgi:hypothetical protein